MRKVAMLGDSLMEYADRVSDWTRLVGIPDYEFKNFGIGGNTIEDVQKRLNPVIDYKPDICFVEVGINNIYHGNPTTLDDLLDTTVLDILKVSIPVVVIQTLPLIRTTIIERLQTCFPDCFFRNEKIVVYNEELRRLAKAESYLLLDIEKLIDHNTMSDDGIHSNAIGYAVWGNAVKEFIESHAI